MTIHAEPDPRPIAVNGRTPIDFKELLLAGESVSARVKEGSL